MDIFGNKQGVVYFALTEQWEDFDNNSQELLNLANISTLVDPSIYKEAPPLASEVPARKHFDLTNYYLIAALHENFPSQHHEMKNWYKTLQTWLLVEAYRRAKLNNFSDKNVYEVAIHIRIASESDRGWLSIIDNLRCASHDFDSMRQSLIYQAGKLISEKGANSSLAISTRKKFLNAIIAPASDEHHVDNKSMSSIPYTIPLPALPKTQEHFNFDIVDFIFTDDDDQPIIHDKYEQDDELEDYTSTEVDCKKPYLHQHIKVNSVLLMQAESLQFLPWSWNTPNIFEVNALKTWIDNRVNNSNNLNDSLIAIIVWLALKTSRSIYLIQQMPVSDKPQAEWTLHPTELVLRRKPPTRHSPWKPKAIEKDWVIPATDYIQLDLPPAMASALKILLHQYPDTMKIGDLWHLADGTPLKSFFTKSMTGQLSRITSSMLANILPNEAYIQTQDSSYARLISTHPRSGLPASCAYASWPTSNVEHIMSDEEKATSFLNIYSPGALIGMGSHMIAIKSAIKHSISHAYTLISQAQIENDFILTHNRYIAYLATALLAATGARPIRDPFESPNFFNHDTKLVYVDDKASGVLRQGRLIPLVTELSEHIKNDYSNYLVELSNILHKQHSQLSREIKSLTDKNKTHHIPYLFFLSCTHNQNSTPKLAWSSVSESSIQSLQLFDWPLPLRLFRHRLANTLRCHSLDSEIIDGIMGHAEAGAASYGDNSTRCLYDDLIHARLSFEESFKSLEFKLRAPRIPIIGTNAFIPGKINPSTEFGAKARETARKSRLRNAYKQADIIINDFLGKKALSELNAEEATSLSEKLLGIKNGNISPTGYLKYIYFERKLEKLSSNSGLEIPIKKRYRRANSESSLITPLSISAPHTYELLCKTFRNSTQNINAKRLPLPHCLAIAATEICLFSRLTSKLLLESLLNNCDYRLVAYQHHAYLEFAPKLSEPITNNRRLAVQRFHIPPLSAQLLNRTLSAKQNTSAECLTLHESLHGLLNILHVKQINISNKPSVKTFIRALSLIVNQKNALDRPGIVAAVLSGRRISVSNNWCDWVRLTENKILQPQSGIANDIETDQFDTNLTRGANTSILPSDLNDETLLSQSKLFFSDLTKCLPENKGTNESISNLDRKIIISAVNKILNTRNSQVSAGIFLLGQWLPSLLKRKKSDGKFITISSVNRYFQALIPAFRDLAYNLDILNMDEDGLTEFYFKIINNRAKLNNAYYSENRLLEFHRWAQSRGIAEPDWSEIPFSNPAWSIAPGYITEQDYQDSLTILFHKSDLDNDLSFLTSFFLILTYRFALRPSEALGLTRDDFKMFDDNIVILVRRNMIRPLKRPKSRRQVPLVFNLTKIEREIISEAIILAEAVHGKNNNAPLFSHENTRNIPLAKNIKEHVTNVLRMVTGNNDIVIYSTRHSCACRIALALFNINLPKWNSNISSKLNDSGDHIRKTLLGLDIHVTRRAPWALATFMGHAGPATAIKSYIHFITEWADSFNSPDKTNINNKLEHITNLDNLSRTNRLDTSLLQLTNIPKCKPSTDLFIKFFRFISLGNPPERSAEKLNLELKWELILDEVIQKIGERLRTYKNPQKESTHNNYEFLQRIPDSRWSSLISMVKNSENETQKINSTIKLDELPFLIGETGQLIMWQENHFSFARKFIKTYNLPQSEYLVLKTKSTPKILNNLAEFYGFKYINPKQCSNKRFPRINSTKLVVEGNDYSVCSRYAIAWRRGDAANIHTAIEFVVVLLATLSSIHFSNSE